jgi:hypothetical protein
MPVFDQLNRVAERHGLKYLVVGGHAVTCHGYVRTTEDTDIVVNKEQRPAWEEALRSLGYSVFHDGGAFLQLKPAPGQSWPLDLMLVGEPTFGSMLSEAKAAVLEGVSVLVPCLEHLLALKLHALKHGHGLRVLKDFDDVARLVAINRVDVHAESFRRLVEKHGSKDIYERLLRSAEL